MGQLSLKIKIRYLKNYKAMKICAITIVEHNQFKDFTIDFTYPSGHPKAGEPMDKLCLIGPNGTGKTTILECLFQAFSPHAEPPPPMFFLVPRPFQLVLKVLLDNQFIYIAKRVGEATCYFKQSIETVENWHHGLAAFSQEHSLEDQDLIHKLNFNDNATDLFIYSPAEGDISQYKGDIPNTNLNESLGLFSNRPALNLINAENVKNFWNLLIYLIKKREKDLQVFQEQEQNQDKTLRQINKEFDAQNPKILDKIADLWNRILEKAGLEFDVKNASIPVQLTENLLAYIKHKSTGKKIEYHQLSTGIRNFIFRVGHIFALYFDRPINKGLLLMDEPENSLYPNFLYDLVDVYFNLTENTQLIMATHSPIIAAQFEPHERLLLDFDENGSIVAQRGLSPKGDDPNDVLIKDFKTENLGGTVGLHKWERYIELKGQILRESNSAKKLKLIEEFMEIGRIYNFPINEVS